MNHKKSLNSLATNSINPKRNSTFLARFTTRITRFLTAFSTTFLTRLLKLTFLFCYLIFLTQNEMLSQASDENTSDSNNKAKSHANTFHKSNNKSSTKTNKQDENVIVIEEFMKKLEFKQIKIHSSGKYISYIHEKDGMANIYIAELSQDNLQAIYNGQPAGVKITNKQDISIKSQSWLGNDVVYISDKNGSENTSITLIENALKYTLKYSLKHELKNSHVDQKNSKNSKNSKLTEHKISPGEDTKNFILLQDKDSILFASNFRKKDKMDIYIWRKNSLKEDIRQKNTPSTQSNGTQKKNHTNKAKIVFVNSANFYAFWASSNMKYIILQRTNSRTNEDEFYIYNIAKALKHNMPHSQIRKITITGEMMLCDKNYVYTYCDYEDKGYIVKTHLRKTLKNEPINTSRNTPINASKNIIFRQKNKQSSVNNVIFLNGQMLGVSTYYAKQKWHTKGFAKKVQNCIEEYAQKNNMSDIEWNILSGNAAKTAFICTINSSNVAPEYYLVQLGKCNLGDCKSKSKNQKPRTEKFHKTDNKQDKIQSQIQDRKHDNIQNKTNKKLISKNHQITQITKTFNKEYSFFKTEAFTFQSPDGLKILCYLTKPETKAITKFPLVVLVHGGPEMRDYMRFCRLTQFFANLGYGVLKVNYRGSDGFGNAFKFAGHGEWAEKSYYDVLNAVKYLKNQGLVSKVCIMGGSYGGYQALVGSWKNPDVFSCGISICGPSDIKTLIKSIPPYWVGLRGHLLKLIFNVKSMKGLETNAKIFRKYKKQINAKSPLNKKISIPMMIVQGKNDVRVREMHSRMMFNKLKKRKIPVTYLLFNNEGHSIHHSENVYYMMMCIDKFLKQSKMLASEMEDNNKGTVVGTSASKKQSHAMNKPSKNSTIYKKPKKPSKNRIKFILRNNTKPKDIIVLEKLAS